MCLLYGTTVRVVNRHGGSRPIDKQLLAGLVFLSAAPHPVCAGCADTARENAEAIAIRVGLAGILSKATTGRAVRRDRVALVSRTWPPRNTLVNAVLPCATETEGFAMAGSAELSR
jgi:hypothetical protein